MLANLRHAYEIEEADSQKLIVERFLGLVTGAVV